MPRLVLGSEFFLDFPRWQALRESVIPELLARRATLRAWSAGCHRGKEPYSLAIVLDELAPDGGHHLLATDHDPELVAVASDGGPFLERDVGRLTPGQHARYLDPGDPPFFVNETLRRSVTFQTHDLRSDPYEDDFDLILYRDVEPFFTSSVNADVHARLFGALRPGGVMFVGSTDTVPCAQEIGFRPRGTSFFQRP